MLNVEVNRKYKQITTGLPITNFDIVKLCLNMARSLFKFDDPLFVCQWHNFIKLNAHRSTTLLRFSKLLLFVLLGYAGREIFEFRTGKLFMGRPVLFQEG